MRSARGNESEAERLKRQAEDAHEKFIQISNRLLRALEEEGEKARDALGRYKFQMLGYHAANWVTLNRIGGFGYSNPFKDLVVLARERKAG
jgi:hypothetical protein